ncbi:MAG TPA: bifunctional 5,10-methylenetetrahydrofolate dehydrogenase/5,10-methenyltetrahydrofolate cyclohydrolase [Candidatus Limnocylindrales bacterium]|nr:bifunctional 5,10-methylenetetrahydrofolate dehydrogenase/5,10-methenyltetrahydrofolate cyclohydrolase [Candidatus Limnocylindrales bacterium]
MSARILDGRAVASRLWRELSERVSALEADPPPRLAIIRFEGNPAAEVYAGSLGRAARSIGVEALEIVPPDGAGMADLSARIGSLNRDPHVSGIVVAQPVPEHLELGAVLALIDPAKDVDGATPLNVGRLARGEDAFAPATALAVMAILRTYEIPIAGRRAVVVGRSSVVGRPVASLLLGADATVMVCHSRTRNLARETRRAEILVVAAGQPGLIRPEMVNRSAVIIDCGINTTADGIVGDVEFDGVRPVVRAITPVPGGVGPVTTMMLLEQTVRSAEAARDERSGQLDRFRVAHPAPSER